MLEGGVGLCVVSLVILKHSVFSAAIFVGIVVPYSIDLMLLIVVCLLFVSFSLN